MTRVRQPPAYMLTGRYFYEPVRAWIAAGTFKHEPQPFGRDEVAASAAAARGRQTALAKGATGTATKRAEREAHGVAKSIRISRAANPAGANTFTCGRCCKVSFVAGSRVRAGNRICGPCGLKERRE